MQHNNSPTPVRTDKACQSFAMMDSNSANCTGTPIFCAVLSHLCSISSKNSLFGVSNGSVFLPALPSNVYPMISFWRAQTPSPYLIFFMEIGSLLFCSCAENLSCTKCITPLAMRQSCLHNDAMAIGINIHMDINKVLQVANFHFIW